MKVFIAIVAVAFVVACEASYLPYDDVLSYPNYASGWPVSKVVVGNSYGLSSVVDKYSYPSWYGGYPLAKNLVSYQSVAPVLSTKVVDNGYGLGYNNYVAPVLATNVVGSSYGLGYNKLVAPVVSTKVVDGGLWNYGGYGV
ncbi:uncharacterized protein LOC131208094 [Anopheles bellator]|uniref:uncharacterized protein LOC131208094 n=1 Tax=Anopheles bellator TaxID=139047 RepID=UPI002649E3AC|nr:uncharacterized protein LOC131208094 [Anopheles bellator]